MTARSRKRHSAITGKNIGRYGLVQAAEFKNRKAIDTHLQMLFPVTSNMVASYIHNVFEWKF